MSIYNPTDLVQKSLVIMVLVCLSFKEKEHKAKLTINNYIKESDRLIQS